MAQATRSGKKTGKTAAKPRAGGAAGGSGKAAAPAGMAAAKAEPAKGAAAKPGAKAAPQQPAAEPPMLKRKELIARAAAASGLKPGEIRRVLDGILGELGKALAAGETVNLPPLGKITVKRREQNESRQLVICRLRRRIGEKTGNPELEPQAE